MVDIKDIHALILCKSDCSYTRELNQFLQNNNISSTLVVDDSHPEKSFLYRNGYYNFTKITNNPTAWERSIFNIEIYGMYKTYQYFYLIEEDVFSLDLIAFVNFISACNNFQHHLISKDIANKNDSLDWVWWQSSEDHQHFKYPVKSFNPICRLSSKLVQKIIEYKNYYEKLSFHEILIPSIANQFNLSILDYSTEPALQNFIGEVGTVQQNIEDMINNKLYHPYKLCNTRYPYIGNQYL